MKNLLALALLATCAWATPADLDQADSLLKSGKPVQARAIAEKELAADPKSLRARLTLAKSALAQNDLQTAHENAAELVKADPKSSDYNALLGLLLVLEGQAEAAIPFLDKSVESGLVEKKSPEQMASFSNTLVTGLHQAGQTPLALKRCLEFLALYPTNGELYLSASRLYRERNDYKNALDIAHKGLQAAPQFSSLYASVALAEAGLGHKDLSEKAYQELHARDPELAKVVRRVLDGTRKDSAELQVEVK